MSSLAVYTPQITIFDRVINAIDGLYSLNDMHKASGGEKKYQPAFFMRNQETKDLIKEIERTDNTKAVKRIQGGIASEQGTYVCKDLVYRYAMWISPKFALAVIRTFDALVTRTDAKQREALVAACDKLAVGNTLRSDVYTLVANHFGYEKVTQIPAPLLPEAVAFTYEMLLARQKTGGVNTDTAMRNEMWRYVGVIKYAQLSDALREAQEASHRLHRAIAGAQRHTGLIYDAFGEQQKLISLGKDGAKEAYKQAEDLVERQDALMSKFRTI